jgi:hypothetical protein
MATVRYAEEHDDIPREGRHGKILVFLKDSYSYDAVLTVEELVQLRAEIDRFLILDRR